MRTMIKVFAAVMLGVLLLSAISVRTPNGAAASEDTAVWVGPFSDGCSYFQDAGAAYWAACPRTDGTIGIVQAQYGSWVYFAKAWIDGNGLLNVVLADNTYLIIGADGSEAIYRTDGTVITVPSYTGECGNYCQPNFGGYYFPSNDASIWLQPRTQPEYSTYCEHPVSGTCFSY